MSLSGNSELLTQLGTILSNKAAGSGGESEHLPGQHDFEQQHEKRHHHGERSGGDSNVWEPGVYGWTEVTE